jgi:tetratricopeptide (TPR) repeat protein
MFTQAQNLHNENKFKESNKILFSLINDITDEGKVPIYTLIGGNYYDSKDYKKAIVFFNKVLEHNKDEELASLGIYLSYVHLEEYDLALEEIFRFLKDHKAVIYKDTLEELLTDIKDGHIQVDVHIKTIKKLAKKNSIKLSQ